MNREVCSPATTDLASILEKEEDFGISPMTNLSNNLGATLTVRSLVFNSNDTTPRKRDSAEFMDISCLSDTPSIADMPKTRDVGLLNQAKNKLLNFGSSGIMYSPSEQLSHSLNNFYMSDKENASQNLNPVESEWEDSPSKLYFSTSQCKLQKNPSRKRFPLEEYDPNSQDSGYSNSCSQTAIEEISNSPNNFRFRQPSGLAPRRQNAVDSSPRNIMGCLTSPCSTSSVAFGGQKRVFRSFSTGSSDLSDDGFIDQLPDENPTQQFVMDQDENAQLPPDFSSLLSRPIFGFNQIVDSPVSSIFSEHKLSRSISLKSTVKTTFDGITQLKMESSGNCSAKRPATESENVPYLKRPRRAKLTVSTTEKPFSLSQPATAPALSSHKTLFDYGFKKTTHTKFHRSYSETEATIIMQAVDKGLSNPDLIGDRSGPFALPLNKEGRHADLKNISCDTLANLISGEFDNKINSYVIVDCRYPYEYDGGHIKGAVNVYTADDIEKQFLEKRSTIHNLNSMGDYIDNLPKRNILIFHCEFSSERGPTMSRHLRSIDRRKNTYPRLHYPEMYLLEGGYKKFYENHKHLCEPCNYVPMKDPNYVSELRFFKSRSKSFSSSTETRSKHSKRLGEIR